MTKKEISVSESSDNASDSDIAKSDSDIADRSDIADKSETEDSGEDVASLKKSPAQRIPKFSSIMGSQKYSSTSSQVEGSLFLNCGPLCCMFTQAISKVNGRKVW